MKQSQVASEYEEKRAIEIEKQRLLLKEEVTKSEMKKQDPKVRK